MLIMGGVLAISNVFLAFTSFGCQIMGIIKLVLSQDVVSKTAR